METDPLVPEHQRFNDSNENDNENDNDSNDDSDCSDGSSALLSPLPALNREISTSLQSFLSTSRHSRAFRRTSSWQILERHQQQFFHNEDEEGEAENDNNDGFEGEHHYNDNHASTRSSQSFTSGRYRRRSRRSRKDDLRSSILSQLSTTTSLDDQIPWSKTNNNTKNIDMARIQQAVRQAGDHAFGVVMVDVWILDEQGVFNHAPGGLWISSAFTRQQVFQQKSYPNKVVTALQRLLNHDHPNYIPPDPQVMGAGLAGYFWTTLGKNTNTHFNQHASEVQPLLWRSLEAITSDPFQPPHPRVQCLQDAGLGRATGIPFDVGGHKGVVLYLTRPTAKVRQLNEVSNISYLQIASLHIGTSCALTLPRMDREVVRQQELSNIWKRIRVKLSVLKAFQSFRSDADENEDDDDDENDNDNDKQFDDVHDDSNSSLFYMLSSNSERPLVESLQQVVHWSKDQVKMAKVAANKKAVLVFHKWKGSETLNPPPGAPLEQCSWTLVGTFLTLTLLMGLSQAVAQSDTLPHENGIILTPFAAFLTLQFSLTAAPAAQPRNAFYGLLWCMSIAWLASTLYLHPSSKNDLEAPHNNSNNETLVICLSVALGVSGMQYWGIVHPPAAGALLALLVRPQGFNWEGAMIFFVASAASIAAAILINNLNEHRQYPVYWRLWPQFQSDGSLLASVVFKLKACWKNLLVPLKKTSSRNESFNLKEQDGLMGYGSTSWQDGMQVRALADQDVTSKTLYSSLSLSDAVPTHESDGHPLYTSSQSSVASQSLTSRGSMLNLEGPSESHENGNTEDIDGVPLAF